MICTKGPGFSFGRRGVTGVGRSWTCLFPALLQRVEVGGVVLGEREVGLDGTRVVVVALKGLRLGDDAVGAGRSGRRGVVCCGGQLKVDLLDLSGQKGGGGDLQTHTREVK